jgi:GR25 family glycosyltransferase involved in LPS biosynthesis
MKTYITHYTKLKDRKMYILEELHRIGISNIEFIEKYDKEDLTKEIIDKYYSTNRKEFEETAQITKNHCGGGEYRILKDSEISLMIKHIHTLIQLSQSKHEYAMILEDDCVFSPWVSVKVIEKFVETCPEDWDVIVIGGGFNHLICKYEYRIKDFLLAKHPATNTTSSMIFKNTTAKKILATFDKFHLSWDWQLNYIFYKNNFKVYHTIPYICGQNNFTTSIQN